MKIDERQTGTSCRIIQYKETKDMASKKKKHEAKNTGLITFLEKSFQKYFGHVLMVKATKDWF